MSFYRDSVSMNVLLVVANAWKLSVLPKFWRNQPDETFLFDSNWALEYFPSHGSCNHTAILLYSILPCRWRQNIPPERKNHRPPQHGANTQQLVQHQCLYCSENCDFILLGNRATSQRKLEFLRPVRLMCVCLNVLWHSINYWIIKSLWNWNESPVRLICVCVCLNVLWHYINYWIIKRLWNWNESPVRLICVCVWLFYDTLSTTELIKRLWNCNESAVTNVIFRRG